MDFAVALDLPCHVMCEAPAVMAKAPVFSLEASRLGWFGLAPGAMVEWGTQQEHVSCTPKTEPSGCTVNSLLAGMVDDDGCGGNKT